MVRVSPGTTLVPGWCAEYLLFRLLHPRNPFIECWSDWEWEE